MYNEKKFNTSVLGGIILSSFSRGDADLPTDFLVVENEIKCGTIDYLQEIENLFLENPPYGSMEMYASNRRIVEKEFRLKMSSKEIKGIFSPEIKKSLEEITNWESFSECRQIDEYNSTCSAGVKSAFAGYFRNLMGDHFQDFVKIGSLPYPTVLHLRNEFLPNCSARQRRDIEKIGKKVKIYRLRDLEGTNLNQFHYWKINSQ